MADKLLTLSAFIMLIQHGLMLAWVTVVILARELCVDGLRMIAVTKGKVIAAGKLGKIKTVSQIVLILWLMIARQPVMARLGRRHPVPVGADDHPAERRGILCEKRQRTVR